MTETSRQLPFDILCVVFEVLAAEKQFKTLKVCALVCKDTRPICQRHLFWHITVDVESYSGSPPRVSGLNEAFQANQTLGQHVRSLHLLILASESFHAGLPSLLSHLNRLHRVEITLLSSTFPACWTEIHPLLASSVRAAATSPTVNTLICRRIIDFPLVSILVEGTNIVHLELTQCGEVRSFDKDKSALHDISLPTRVRGLETLVEEFGYTSAIENLLKASTHDGRPLFDFENISSLSAWVSNLRAYNSLKTLVSRAKKLESFHVQVEGNKELEDLLSSIFKSSIRTLKSLHLSRCAFMENPLSVIWADIATLPADTNISSLYIKAHCPPDIPTAEDGRWFPSKEIITRKRFPALEFMKIQLMLSCVVHPHVRKKNRREQKRVMNAMEIGSLRETFGKGFTLECVCDIDL